MTSPTEPENALDDLRVRVEGGCGPTVGEATDTGATRGPNPSLPLDGFYIYSSKWTRGDYMTWWRPNNAGYCQNLYDAGVYSREEVEGAADYYNNGHSTLAVPVAAVHDVARVRLVVDTSVKLIDSFIEQSRAALTNTPTPDVASSPQTADDASGMHANTKEKL